MIEPGTRFKVPTKQQFLDNSWKEDSAGDLQHSGVYRFNCVVPGMLKFSGKVLTVGREVANYSEWFYADGFRHYWPVQACLNICGEQSASPLAKETPTGCICSPGSTPLMGFIICKHCGKDLEKV